MTDSRGRTRTGPLNRRQMQIIARVARGMQHKEIAQELGVARNCVSENMTVVVLKMNVTNSAEAVARWSRYETLRHSAQVLASKGQPHLAREFDARAARLLPS